MSDCTCAVLGCKPEPGSSIHYLPRNPVLKQLWMDFIYRHSRPSNTVVIRICGAHFSSDCFVNFCQRSMGFAKKLILKPDAVPSIYPGSHPGLQHGPAALCLKRADVACQCNSVVLHDVGLQCSLPLNRTRTVGTQLSERRLIYRRSLGVQTKLHTTGAGTVETRTAEQSVGRLISSSQKPPPSPPADWSQPEIEDDDQCVTVNEPFVSTDLFLPRPPCFYSPERSNQTLTLERAIHIFASASHRSSSTRLTHGSKAMYCCGREQQKNLF